MLKYRLIFGTLLTIGLSGLLVFDAWLDGSLSASVPNAPVQGTFFYILIAILIVLAQIEFCKLAAAKKLVIFLPFSVIISILLAGGWYWTQIIPISAALYFAGLLAISFFGLFVYQFRRWGTNAAIANCSANYFSIIYLGLLSAFAVAIRVDFGFWPFMMFIFTIKSADIGAYTLGSLFGKHKFAPKISPGKTWEGMAGAVIASIIVTVIFAGFCGIMHLLASVAFGFAFAFIGQFGDLIESMLKRDAEQKDSSNTIPGFGGVLDLVDSPLPAACVAYIYFKIFMVH